MVTQIKLDPECRFERDAYFVQSPAETRSNQSTLGAATSGGRPNAPRMHTAKAARPEARSSRLPAPGSRLSNARLELPLRYGGAGGPVGGIEMSFERGGPPELELNLLLFYMVFYNVPVGSTGVSLGTGPLNTSLSLSHSLSRSPSTHPLPPPLPHVSIKFNFNSNTIYIKYIPHI